MARIIIRKYSTFWDVTTGIQFQPVLDVASNTYVGAAEVDAETAEKFRGRRGFEVLDSQGFIALTSREPDPEPLEPITGDPLSDQAADGADLLEPTTGDPLSAAPVETAGAGDADRRRKAAAPPPPPPSS